MRTTVEMNTHNKSTPFSRWKPIEIMLAILFLVAPFYYHSNIGGTGLRLPNNITVWMIATLVVCYSFYKLAHRCKISIPKYFGYVIAFPLLATASGFIASVDNPIEWFFRLLFVWFGLLFYIALFQHKLTSGRVDRILFVILISALIQGIVGVLQITISDVLPAWFPRLGSQVAQLPYGVFQQINNQVTYQVSAFIIAIFLITRPYITKGPLWKRVVVFLFFCLSGFIISYSGARVGILSILVATPFVIKGRWLMLNKNKQLAIASILFFGLGTVVGNSGLDRGVDKLAQISDGYTASARVGIYAVSLDLIQQKPFFGHGIGNFEYKWQFEKANFYQSHPDAKLIDQYITHPHNELLFWMIEGGIVAVSGMFIVFAGILLSLRGLNHFRWGAYLAFLIPIAIHTQVELPFYTSAIHWFLFLFLLFVLMRGNSQEYRITISLAASKLLKLASIITFLVGTVFLTHSVLANNELSKTNTTVSEIALASSNPYFFDIVESMQMKTILQYAIQNKSFEDIEYFTRWAESFMFKEPSEQLFVFLALAYQEINKDNEMCQTLKLGKSIYPNSENLKSGVEFCKI